MFKKERSIGPFWELSALLDSDNKTKEVVLRMFSWPTLGGLKIWRSNNWNLPFFRSHTLEYVGRLFKSLALTEQRNWLP